MLYYKLTGNSFFLKLLLLANDEYIKINSYVLFNLSYTILYLVISEEYFDSFEVHELLRN